MKIRALYLAIALGLLFLSRLPAQQIVRLPFVLTPALKALKDQLLTDARTQVNAPYQQELTALNSQYLAALNRMIANPPPTVTKAQLEQEREEINQKGKLPPLDFDGTPPDVVKLRQAYRKSLAPIEAKAEAKWTVMKEKYYQEADKHQPDPRAHRVLQKRWLMDVQKDLDFVPDNSKDRIIGTWKITRSDRQEAEWTLTPMYAVGGYFKLETPVGSGSLEALPSTWKERFPGSEHDWVFTSQSQIRFEGAASKERPVLRICGERSRPWRDPP